MVSLDDLMARAEKLGRLAADKGAARNLLSVMATTETGAGNGTGGLALDAFREHGEEGMRVVLTGYQTGYRGRTQALEMEREGIA